MRYISRSWLAIILILCFVSANVYCAPQARRPKVVLVQLRSENNRIQALARSNQQALLEEVKKDSKGAADAMIADFKDHFDYCPVYFFIDTNADKIKEKNFGHILLNADGSEATASLTGTNDYVIVYYGYPSEQEQKNVAPTDRPASGAGRGIIVLNSEYEQVAYSAKLAYQERFRKNRNSKYYYKSAHFDIQYVPMASTLNDNLKGSDTRSFRGPVVVKHYK